MRSFRQIEEPWLPEHSAATSVPQGRSKASRQREPKTLCRPPLSHDLPATRARTAFSMGIFCARPPRCSRSMATRSKQNTSGNSAEGSNTSTVFGLWVSYPDAPKPHDKAARMGRCCGVTFISLRAASTGRSGDCWLCYGCAGACAFGQTARTGWRLTCCLPGAYSTNPPLDRPARLPF